ncbi:MAG: type I-F CRISPR-associated protein Csy3 [Paraglaciecola sp.]|uniref:type I-F CRISPR-associated protein Csy3 n=1 Tax=Paraglaciecola sp. TaxID=1920173 RepID=UPI00273D31C6|nr:type I-F CRISPR-associated protein Csy3 [Paraglaciecola sp.]MDP5032819.1 type I-F CRISPR-associated protein Csy3 [Paraglaciecola sp.]MDP5129814.1 type I-F CRISPR-associated protein Csy3 [Paraglaciecola sp.]
MELCNLLKYDRSLYPSKAVFFYKTAESDFVPLEAEINRIRGQKSGFAEAYTPQFNPKNLAPHDLAYCNPLTIEECYVPPNIQHIYCRFSLRVQANSLKPSGCSDHRVSSLLEELSKAFYRCNGYKELASRFCKNLLLGTWLWRNQNTGNTQINIKTSTGRLYQINNTRQLAWDVWSDDAQAVLDELSTEMVLALTDKNVFWSADVTAKIETSFCQEIYPSQVFTEKPERGESKKNFAKVRCDNGRYAVSFNSVKIGAAIQLIDNWWDGDALLRVHEYGADPVLGIARRSPESELSFYSLFVNAERYLEELSKQIAMPEPIIHPNIYYIFAVLIKGGMFQKKTEKKE